METPGNMTTGFNNGGSPVAKTVDKASTGAHSVINKVSEAAHPALDRFASGVHRAVDKVAGATTQTAQTLSEKSVQFRKVQIQATEQCRVYVRANPLAAVGIALAAGYLLSRLLRAR
jgi:ElaB/YqjD/DUF883 family membrane-anchored ribosome-binding protein